MELRYLAPWVLLLWMLPFQLLGQTKQENHPDFQPYRATSLKTTSKTAANATPLLERQAAYHLSVLSSVPIWNGHSLQGHYEKPPKFKAEGMLADSVGTGAPTVIEEIVQTETGDIAGKGNAAYDLNVFKGFVANNLDLFTPGDNSMGISDGGYIVSADNFTIDYYGDGPDTLLQFQHHDAFYGDSSIAGAPFDPRVMYDRYFNRFIVLTLLYSADTTNFMFLSFSRDEDPRNGWNHYRVRTDSLDDGQWMDFPSVGMNQDEIFVTGHMTTDNNQYGGNKIFQIHKQEGYAGQTLKLRTWYDVLDAEGDPVHTIVPLSDGLMRDSYDKGIYLVSTKYITGNQSSDKLFWYRITDTYDAPGVNLTVAMTNAQVAYSDPPPASQLGANALIKVSDVKVHSGFFMDSTLNFVYCREFQGYSVVVLNRLDLRTGSLLRIPWGNTGGQMSYSFPSIAFSGADSTDPDNITLCFLRTGAGLYPEIAAVHYDDGAFWPSSTLVKAGEGHIDYFGGNTIERWGDYSTIQRRYNTNPSRCWLVGGYPNGPNANYWGATYLLNAYIAEVGDPVAQPVEHAIVGGAAGVHVHPNPLQGKTTIVSDQSNQMITGFTIRDLNGKVFARNEVLPCLDLEISLEGLASGVYLLDVAVNGKMRHYERLVVVTGD